MNGRGGIRLHDEYLLKEIRTPFVIALIACVMMMVVQELYLLLQQVPLQRFPPDTLALYLLYKVPGVVQKAMPVALLLGASLAVSRLVHEMELTAMRIGGLPLWRFLLPLSAVGVIAGFGSLLLGEQVAPSADHRAEALYRQLTFQTQVAGLQPDTFFRYGNRIVYFHLSYPATPGRTELQGVVVYQIPGAGDSTDAGGSPEGADAQDSAATARSAPRFWTAERAEVEGQTWTLLDVTEHRLSPHGEILADVPAPQMRINLHRSLQFFLTNPQKPEEMTAAELRNRVQVEKRISAPAAVILPLEYEYHFRYALPFACLVFAMVGAPLTIRFARGGSFVGILVSFGVLFFYYDLLVIAEKLALSGAAPPVVAVWLPNVLFCSLGAILSLQEP